MINQLTQEEADVIIKKMASTQKRMDTIAKQELPHIQYKTLKNNLDNWYKTIGYQKMLSDEFISWRTSKIKQTIPNFVIPDETYKPIQDKKPKRKNTTLTGLARRNKEIQSLKSNKSRNANQEKRLKQLLKLK